MSILKVRHKYYQESWNSSKLNEHGERRFRRSGVQFANERRDGERNSKLEKAVSGLLLHHSFAWV